MKKKKLLLVLTLLISSGALSSCQSTGTVGVVEDKEAAEVDDVSQVYHPTINEESPYGYVVPSVASCLPGSEITYTVYSYDEIYDPVALIVNGETLELDEDDTLTTTMADDGNTVKPIFRADLSDFSVIPQYYSLSVVEIEGCEYRLDDGEWQSSPNFTDLIPHYTYEVSIRMAGDGDTLLDSEIFTKTVQTIPLNNLGLDHLITSFALKGEIVSTAESYGEVLSTASVAVNSYLSSSRYTLQIGDDYDATYYLGSGNTITTQEVNRYNEVVSTYVGDDFDTTFLNPFTQITNDDLSVSSDRRYLYVDLDAVSTTTIFANIFFGDSAINATEIRIEIDDEGTPVALHYEGYAYDTSTIGTKWVYVYDADFVDDIDVAGTQSYQTEPEHEKLRELFDELAELNYTAQISTYNYQTNNIVNATLEVTENSALTTASDGSQTGMLQTDDGFYRFSVTEEGDETYLDYESGYPLESLTLSFYAPTFDFAPEVFEVQEDGTFVLRSVTTFYNYATDVLPDVLATEISEALYIVTGSLIIDVADDLESAVFTYFFYDTSEDDYGAVEVEVSAIGETTFPYDESQLRSI